MSDPRVQQRFDMMKRKGESEDALTSLVELLVEREELWREYVEFLGKSNKGAISMAYVHGWRCPNFIAEQGQKYRRRLSIKENE